MTILKLTSAALLAAGLGFAGAAHAAPAANLSGDQQATQRSDEGAVTPVYHRYHYGYYGYNPYYYPRYRYYRPYYGYYGYPYGYGYYGSPSFNFGIHIR
jgi:hypothetical protein